MECTVCGSDVPYYEGERGVYRGQCQTCGKGYGGHPDNPDLHEAWEAQLKAQEEQEAQDRLVRIMEQMAVRDKYYLLTDSDMVYGPFEDIYQAHQQSYHCERHGDFYYNLVKVGSVSFWGDITIFKNYEGMECQSVRETS